MTSTFYADTATLLPGFPPLRGAARADVVVVGGGFTGMGAALELRARGLSVIVLEAARVGAGGSGRNGGQLHPGQRRDQPWLEKRVGEADARALWEIAEAARADLHALIARHRIDCDWRPGLLHPHHRPGGADEDRRFAEHLSGRYGYDQIELLGREAMAAKLGSEIYFEGLLDRGGGHLHPLKLLLGMARAATAAGAIVHEQSRVLDWRPGQGGVTVRTAEGEVVADQLILSGDGELGGLAAGEATARVATLANYIAVTEPLPAPHAETLLPGGEAAADSRFVINYWRRTPDGRLLFGGGETYGRGEPADIAAFVSRPMLKVYPKLKDVKITHAWGGRVGITMRRMPFVRRLAPRVLISAGYSGQGVMLAPYYGKLLGQAAAGAADGLDVLSRVAAPPFPGGPLLREPVLAAGLSYFALRDRLG